jgi:hypothetical protein
MRLTPIVPGLLIILGLVGCATPVVGTPPVVVSCAQPVNSVRSGPALVGQSYGLAMTPLPFNSVQFGSHSASNLLAVQSLYAERSAADTVQVTARFVSCQDAPQVIRVRTSFLRASQAPAEAPSAWKQVYLEPRATALYTELSTARDVANYLIEVAQ